MFLLMNSKGFPYMQQERPGSKLLHFTVEVLRRSICYYRVTSPISTLASPIQRAVCPFCPLLPPLCPS